MPKRSTHPEHEEDTYPDEEQGILKRPSPDQRRLQIGSGEAEKDVYEDEDLEELREDDEVDDWEEGFMEGAKGKGGLANCAHCDKPLPAKAKVVEKVIDDERFFFCSPQCAGKGPA